MIRKGLLPVPEDKPKSEKEDKSERPRRSPITWAVLIAAFLVLVLIAPGIHPLRRAVPPTQPVAVFPPVPPQQKVGSSQLAQCERVIQQGQQLGLIRSRPQKERIDVDENLWGLMDASERRGLLLALQCSAHPSAARPEGPALIYGARSGKMLAQASARGTTLD